LELRSIVGGVLAQTSDNLPAAPEKWQLVAGNPPDQQLLDELLFGWAVVRHVKSNAITVSGNGSLYGVGAGQMSRVDSVRIALEKAGERARGGVLASDAFFPFPDSIPLAAAAGIRAVVQPGGSVKDADVIAAAKEHGLTMLLTGVRHFKH
jgi:phosphoribosylaminoimidazolecarboxamide formyltransferase/IMP cyclohydrolase